MRHKLAICILLLTLVPNKAWPQPRKVAIPDQGTVVFGGMAPIPVDNRSSEEKRYEAAIISAAHYFAHQGYIDHLLAILTMHPTLVDAPVPQQSGKPMAFEGYTMLHLAAANQRATLIVLLLEKGADVNAKCGLDWTPLHFAAKSGNLEIVKLLVEHGAKVGAETKPQPAIMIPCGSPDSPGGMIPEQPTYTPLSLANEHHHEKVVEYLLSRLGIQ